MKGMWIFVEEKERSASKTTWDRSYLYETFEVLNFLISALATFPDAIYPVEQKQDVDNYSPLGSEICTPMQQA